jgi:hypothetical protein
VFKLELLIRNYVMCGSVTRGRQAVKLELRGGTISTLITDGINFNYAANKKGSNLSVIIIIGLKISSSGLSDNGITNHVLILYSRGITNTSYFTLLTAVNQMVKRSGTTHSESTAKSVNVMGALTGYPFNIIGKDDESFA